MHRTIFLLLFHRDVQLTDLDVQAMISPIEFCSRSGGVLLVALEYRFSLQLKWHELGQGEKASCNFLHQLFAMSSRDCLITSAS